MNKPALPSTLTACIGLCDGCESEDATRSRGYGVYFEEVCDRCYLRYIMGKP